MSALGPFLVLCVVGAGPDKDLFVHDFSDREAARAFWASVMTSHGLPVVEAHLSPVDAVRYPPLDPPVQPSETTGAQNAAIAGRSRSKRRKK